MPEVLTRLEQLLKEVGLEGEEIIIRMTGCPNGCARPYTAELALVGKAPGKYQLYVGGNQPGTQLGSLYKESVKSDDLVTELRPVFSRFARERAGEERFGDFARRVLLPEKLASQPSGEAAAAAA
jgi:sulfite reductase (NADPH) hemoprotein beta-component